ncbi:MAG TPA: efflux RND transporter permease subunit, partial [Bryobacteraceae bacterium]|nr:efflux RND transporter permease subunit [Bryobacteraceae bacterium]
MIHRIVKFALEQRFLVMVLAVALIVAGGFSFSKMPVDAYPDLAPPMVDLVTQWPGHAAEEVERLTTLPLELAMNGTPKMRVMRSVSLYGLSEVVLTFEEGTDDYFARQVAFQRLADADLPEGITPSMAPLFSPSGLVYRYVLESPDRTPQELHIFEDWVVERAYRSVPGVADDSGFGGPTMEYHVLLDPVKLYNFHIPVSQVVSALSSNNSNTGGGFYSKGGQFNYVRGIG